MSYFFTFVLFPAREVYSSYTADHAPTSLHLQSVVRSLALVVIFMALPLSALGQDPLYAEGGARALGLGGAATALHDVPWGHANAAAWSTLGDRSISVFASQTFGLAEMRLGAVVWAEPFSWGTVAAGARSYGFDAYRETHALIGAARGFTLGSTRTFHVGVAARYHHLALAAPYGSSGTVGVSAGWLVELLPPLSLGFHATNLNFPDLGGIDLPRTFALGLSYQPAPSVTVVVDGVKDVQWPLTVRGGVEVMPVDALALRAGANLQPARYTIGIGLHVGPLRVDVAADRHENAELGWSPALSLTAQW